MYLDKLDIFMAPGFDKMHPRILKKLTEEVSEPLAIVEKSWKMGEISEDRERSNVVPIYTKGNKDT